MVYFCLKYRRPLSRAATPEDARLYRLPTFSCFGRRVRVLRAMADVGVKPTWAIIHGMEEFYDVRLKGYQERHKLMVREMEKEWKTRPFGEPDRKM